MITTTDTKTDKDLASSIEEYRQRFTKVAEPQTADQWKEHNELLPIHTLIATLDNLEQKLEETQQLLNSEQKKEQSQDAELAELAKEELEQLTSRRQETLEKLREEIKKTIEQKDDNDSKNAILEIRAGAGGEEASLFAGDLFRMYSQFAQKNGFKVEVLSQNLSDTAGIKEVIAMISSTPNARNAGSAQTGSAQKGPYGKFKYESGVHRVQRVPVTESSGRIHTSTASVAVIPEAQEVDIEIKPEDIKIDVFRASGAGGQHVNKTDSAVRITHLPTNTIVSCQESRSQLKNRETAMNILRSRLYQVQQEQQAEQRADIRRNQIGGAMRAEKIRTYNFPQSRITDHRLKKSWHNIEAILDGELDDILEEFDKKGADN